MEGRLRRRSRGSFAASFSALRTNPGLRTCARASQLPYLTLKLGCFPLRQKVAHAIERLQDVFRRVGIGQAYVTFTENSEIRPANDGDTSIFQERRRQRLRLPSGALDIWKGIERTLRRRTGDTRQFVQALDHDFPPLVEFGDHLVNFVLWPFQRGKAGILSRGVDA